jgi:hypothetical protein
MLSTETGQFIHTKEYGIAFSLLIQKSTYFKDRINHEVVFCWY